MNTKSTTKIVAVVCALIVGINVFVSCGNQELQDQLAKVELQKQEMQKQFDSIMFKYEKVKSENVLYTEQFVEKDSIIETQATKIKNLFAELNAAQSNSGQGGSGTTTTKTSKLREQIKELQQNCDNYTQELAALRAENEKLKNENQQVLIKMGETQVTNEKLAQENQMLNQKIEKARQLVTSDLTVTPMKKKCSGKGLTDTKYSSRVTTVKVETRLLANDVIDPGTKTIYLRITGPNNRVLCNGTAEEFSFDVDGSPLQYTAKQDIEYEGNARNVIINWNKNENVKITKGTYRVSLYAEGREIGKTSFKLTK